MSDVKTQADVTDVRPLDLEAARIAVKPIVDAELQAERPVGCLRCIELQRDISALQSRCEAAEKEQDRLREALQKTMTRLADYLDSDHFNNIEAIVLAAGVPYPTALAPQEPTT